MDMDLLRGAGAARTQRAAPAARPLRRGDGIEAELRVRFRDAVVVLRPQLRHRVARRGAFRVDADRAGHARPVGDEAGQLLIRVASRTGSMLPPLTIATVGGPGGTCSRAA